jgi:hypothetical protein
MKTGKGQSVMNTTMRDLTEIELEAVAGAGAVGSNTDGSTNTGGSPTTILNKVRFLGPPETGTATGS